jgi:hypothetical protein
MLSDQDIADLNVREIGNSFTIYLRNTYKVEKGFTMTMDNEEQGTVAYTAIPGPHLPSGGLTGP